MPTPLLKLPKGLSRRFRTATRQAEAVTGRRDISEQAARQFFEAELDASLGRASQLEQVALNRDIFAHDVAQQRKDRRRADAAAKIKGITGLATSAVRLGGTFPGVAPKVGGVVRAGLGKLGGIISPSTPGFGGVASSGGAATAAAEAIGTAPTLTGLTHTGFLSAEGPTAIAPAAGGGALGAVAPPVAAASIGGTIGREIFDSDVGSIGGSVAAGAAAGSIIPGVGTLIGAGIGLVTGLVGEVFGGDDKVICNELNRQGYIPDEILVLDEAHCKKYIDSYTLAGYHRWANTVVGWMQKSPLVTQIVRPLGVGWAYEMAHRMNPEIKGSIIGKILIKVGTPLCRFLGKEKKWAFSRT